MVIMNWFDNEFFEALLMMDVGEGLKKLKEKETKAKNPSGSIVEAYNKSREENKELKERIIIYKAELNKLSEENHDYEQAYGKALSTITDLEMKLSKYVNFVDMLVECRKYQLDPKVMSFDMETFLKAIEAFKR